MTDPSATDKLLAQDRSDLVRVPVEDLADQVAQGTGLAHLARS